VFALAVCPRPSEAQPPTAEALAEQLFQEGRALVRTGNYADACPRFEASLRHDPALGTRLNLADCYEHVGKLASAWALYRESADIARKADDDARRKFASDHVAALGPRLPRLVIQVASTAGATGFAVTRDGVTVDPSLFGVATFVDPGDHEVVASAIGYEPHILRVAVAERQIATIAVPVLARSRTDAAPEDDAAAHRVDRQVPAVLGPPPFEDPPGTRAGGDRGRWMRIAGLATAGAGAAIAGVGLTYFGRRARSLSDELSRPRAVYDPDRYARGEAAERNAIIAGAAGGVLVAGGVALYLVGRSRPSSAERVTVAPLVSPDIVGVVFTGGFP